MTDSIPERAEVLKVYEVMLKRIAHSCKIGAQWLTGIANGRRENPEVVMLVARGMLKAIEDIDFRQAEILVAIAQTCEYMYLSEKSEYHMETGPEFIKEMLLELRAIRSEGFVSK